MAVAMIGPKFYAWDRNGKPLAFGKLYTYQARTNVPKPTYQSEDQVVANSNPVILNGEGYANVYLSGSYKMVLKDKDENEIWSSDPVSEQGGGDFTYTLTSLYVSSNAVSVNGDHATAFPEGAAVTIGFNDTGNDESSTVIRSRFDGSLTEIKIADPVVRPSVNQVSVSNGFSVVAGYQEELGKYVLRNVGDYGQNPYLNEFFEFASFNGIPYFPKSPPYQVDSAAYPDPNADPNLAMGYVSSESLITSLGSSQPRALKERFAEVANVLDFGAVGDGVTDDLSSVQNAINSLPGTGVVLFPDYGGKQYYLSDKPSGAGAGYVFVYHGSAKITEKSKFPNGVHYLQFTQLGTESSYQASFIIGDTIDQPAIAGKKVNGGRTLLEFGGTGTRGGRHATIGILNQVAETESDNTDRNYAAVVGQAIGSSTTGDGGEPLDRKGALFASNFITQALAGYENIANITASEMNTFMSVGSSCRYKSIAQFVTGDQVKADVTDAGVVVSALNSAVGMDYAFLVSDDNGASPLDPLTGTIFGTKNLFNSLTAYRGIDLLGYTIADNVFTSNQFKVLGDGSLEVGNPPVSGTPKVDFHSSGGNNDFDSRIQALGGDGGNGTGSLQILCNAIITDGLIRPAGDNTIDLGAAGFRWKEIFSANGTINTSDERNKTDISDIPDDVLDAWAEVPKRRYRWIESKDSKGAAARWHVGVIAQDIVKAFERNGLDATQWGVLCFDKWDEQVIEIPEVTAVKLDDDGSPITKIKLGENGKKITKTVKVPIYNSDGEEVGEEEVERYELENVTYVKEKSRTIINPAGERYGVRYSEASQLDAALDRRERKKLEAKIDALLNG